MSSATNDEFSIEPEPAKALAAQEECRLLENAYKRNARSGPVRPRLARLLNLVDRFDETVALLGDVPAAALCFEELLALAQALLARETQQDSRRAKAAAERAVALARSDAERSTALAEGAKAAFRLGEPEFAVELLEEALRADRSNATAFKRLAGHWLRSRNSKAVIGLTDRLMANGVAHSRLLSARMLALAQSGRIGEARELLNLAGFLHKQLLPSPPGWRDLDAFNAELGAELLDHPGLRYGRYGTASRDSWRIDSPVTGPAPAARALIAAIAQLCRRHVAAFPRLAHPWLAARPAHATVASWCVITGADGFEDWHTHSEGWMSGTYYVDVPQAVTEGAAEAGCLALGLPEGLAGSEAAASFGTELVRPRPGLLVLFPAHGYHRTFAHGSERRRICISFDLRPC
jgi:tetratricopeptide (TPR) repeat protein